MPDDTASPIRKGDDDETLCAPDRNGDRCWLWRGQHDAYGALFDKHGGTSSVLGSPTGLGCTPATGTDQPSFILLDPLMGPVSNIFTQGYHVTPYDSLTIAIRRARITFGGQVFTVKQTSW